MSYNRRAIAALLATASASALAGCQRAQNFAGAGTVAGATTGGGGPSAGLQATIARARPDMAAVLTQLGELGVQPVENLTVERARDQPTPADAVRRVLEGRGQPTAPRPMAEVRPVPIPGPGGVAIPARLYIPQTAATGRGGAMPLIVYWHGGWVIADLDTYDASARALAAESGAMVLSAHYRQAPEHRFPAAHEDGVTAWRWAAANARRLGADPARMAVAGESAGGNLAINTAIAARDARLPMPVHMALIYPVAGTDTNTPSYRENTAAVPHSRAGMLWFAERVTRSPADLQDPRLDLVGRADLRGLPPATIATAEIDPLRSDGEALAGRLSAAGVPVEQRNWPGATHEFFGMPPAVSAAADAQAWVGERLRRALSGAARVAAVR